MSTDLQKDLAEAIVKNQQLPRDQRKNKKELLVSTGYSPITAKSIPSEIIESKGVKEALREWGLDEALITKALVEDIKAKPKNRVKELGLGADILGMKESTEKSGEKTLVLMVTGESVKRYGIKPNRKPEDSSS